MKTSSLKFLLAYQQGNLLFFLIVTWQLAFRIMQWDKWWGGDFTKQVMWHKNQQVDKFALINLVYLFNKEKII